MDVSGSLCFSHTEDGNSLLQSQQHLLTVRCSHWVVGKVCEGVSTSLGFLADFLVPALVHIAGKSAVLEETMDLAQT